MLPYIPQPTLQLGPLTIHAFGVLVATAVIVGVKLAERRARRAGLDDAVTHRLMIWILVGGFAGGHLVDRIFYAPADTLARPWTLLLPWVGISSMGGLAGAVAGAALFLQRARLGMDGWRHLDAVAYAFPFGWIFGRAGCFLAFDHPGVPTQFFLGEHDAAGTVRHNLGLEEALYTVLLAALFAWLGRKPRRCGTYVGLLALLYAPVRFALDFLRVGDRRYAGLTPAQHATLALLLAGAVILTRIRARPECVPT